MQLHVSGDLVVCSDDLYKLSVLNDSLGNLPLWFFSRIGLFLCFPSAALAELLDNAVDEVIFPDAWTMKLLEFLNSL